MELTNTYSIVPKDGWYKVYCGSKFIQSFDDEWQAYQFLGERLLKISKLMKDRVNDLESK